MNNRGSALLQVMIGMTVVSGIVARIMLTTQHAQKEQFLEKQQIARNDIGKALGTLIRDPEVLAKSASSEIPYIGNRMLRTCLGYDFMNDDDGESLLSGGCDPSKEYPIMLVPNDSYVYPPTVQGSVMNCPNQNLDPNSRDISCYLAGDRQTLIGVSTGDTVGYDFKGNIGKLSANFPLEAKAFFTPICRDPDPTLSGAAQVAYLNAQCGFASKIQVRYTITHKNMPANTVGFFGTYPKNADPVILERSTIVGSTCNLGAKVFVIGSDSSILCRCQLPYKQKFGSDGAPVVNARGPVCQLEAKPCANGFVMVGQDENGQPICTVMQDTDFYKWSYNYDSQTALGNIFSCKVTNSNITVYGWVSSITRDCRSYLAVQEMEHQEGMDLNSILLMAGGAAIGILFPWVITLYTAIMMITGGIDIGQGLVMLAISLLPLGGGAMGAILGYILGLSWDWSLVSANMETDANHPQILCKGVITCRAFKPASSY